MTSPLTPPPAFLAKFKVRPLHAGWTANSRETQRDWDATLKGWLACAEEFQRDADKCICKVNWRDIVAETEHLIGQQFNDRHGTIYTYFGPVHGGDDYYYGMYRKGDMQLLSCVGNFEGHGFTPVINGLIKQSKEPPR